VLSIYHTLPEYQFEKSSGHTTTLANEIDMIEWAKDKREVWKKVVKRFGGKGEAFDLVPGDSSIGLRAKTGRQFLPSTKPGAMDGNAVIPR
jgi:hypothetical protein